MFVAGTVLFVAACSGSASTGDSAPNAAVLDRGRAVYQANCAVCHGDRGQGESPNWKSPNADRTYPAPPHDSSGHTWHHPDQVLFDIVKNGGGQYNSPTFQSRMPASSGNLSDEEIRAALAYIKTMWGPRERDEQRKITENWPRPNPIQRGP